MTEIIRKEKKTGEKVYTLQFQPLLNDDVVEFSLDKATIDNIIGYKIIAYRIKWHGFKNFQWSTWFVPGVNDLYHEEETKGYRSYMACFNDHVFEIIGLR